MLLRPYSLKKINQSIVNNNNTLSPKALKKPTYIRLKANKQKGTKSGRSLCSIQTYRQSSSLTNRRMLSHRKLISVSSLQHRQNLTDRKAPPTQSLKQNKFTTLESQRIHVKQAKSTLEPKQSYMKKPHVNKFTRRNDRLFTIQNQDPSEQNLQKVLQIKENILKQFIDRFQQQLRQISQKKSNSIVGSKTLLTNRKFDNNNNNSKQSLILKQQTTKKPRLNSLLAAASLQSNRSTINLEQCAKENKQNIALHVQQQQQGIEKNRFQEYIKSLKDHKKKDQKILIMKNHNNKRSLQSISISRIGETQNLLTNRLNNNKIQPKHGNGTNNNRMNLKQLFKHSKKYQPYLRQGSTLILNDNDIPNNIQQQKIQSTIIQQKQSKLQRSSSLLISQQSPIISRKKQQQQQQQKQNQQQQQKQNQQPINNTNNNQSYADCSSIQKMNQSSFISQVGRKSLLKHLQKQSAKLVREQNNKKTKKCLTKIKSIFPANFF